MKPNSKWFIPNRCDAFAFALLLLYLTLLLMPLLWQSAMGRWYGGPRVLLRQVENAYLQEVGRSLSEVRQSRFKAKPSAAGFEFKLTQMAFRTAVSD